MGVAHLGPPLGAGRAAPPNLRASPPQTSRRPRGALVVCSTGGGGLAPAVPSGSSSEAPPAAAAASAPAAVRVRAAGARDFWPVADAHCAAFYPRAGALWGPLLRLDRVLSLHVGGERGAAAAARAGGGAEGRFACLVAAAPPPAAAAPPEPLGPLAGAAAAALLPRALARAGAGAAAARAAGVLGAVVVDTLGDHLPPGRGPAPAPLPRGAGALLAAERPRRGVAYLSNLAVAPGARRRGLGAALLRAAEAQAAAWGCRLVALHVDAGNAGAAALYERAGYRRVSPRAARRGGGGGGGEGPLAAAWAAALGGGSGGGGGGLVLMARRLPQRRGEGERGE